MQKRIQVKKQSGSPKILNFRNLKGTGTLPSVFFKISTCDGVRSPWKAYMYSFNPKESASKLTNCVQF
jgi:hypothetical protein